jgi:hypothetical protein
MWSGLRLSKSLRPQLAAWRSGKMQESWQFSFFCSPPKDAPRDLGEFVFAFLREPVSGADCATV